MIEETVPEMIVKKATPWKYDCEKTTLEVGAKSLQYRSRRGSRGLGVTGRVAAAVPEQARLPGLGVTGRVAAAVPEQTRLPGTGSYRTGSRCSTGAAAAPRVGVSRDVT